MHISINYRTLSENEIWNLGKLLPYSYIHFLSDPIGKRNLESGKAITICIYPFPIGSHRKMKFGIWESYYHTHISISYWIPSDGYHYIHISISYRIPSEIEIWNLGKLLWYAYILFLSDPIGKRKFGT